MMYPEEIEELFLRFDLARIFIAEEEEEEEEEPNIVVSLGDITDRKRAEKAQRESEERYKELWDNAPVAYHTLDTKGTIIRANQTEAKMLGYTPEEMAGKSIFEFILPEQQEEARQRFQLKIAGQQIPKQVDRMYVNKDGLKINVSIDDVLERDIEGKVVGVRTTMIDITERKRQEMIQLVLYHISCAVHSTKSISELSGVIQQELGTIIDTKNFFIALYNKENDTISLPYYKDEKDHFEIFPAGKTCTAYIIHNDKSLLANRKKIDELVQSGEIEIIGTISKVWLGVPLKFGEEVTGVIVVQSYTDENTYSEKDLKILEFVASEVGLFIERKRAEEALRESDNRYRQLVDNTDTGFVVIDDRGIVIEANEPYMRLIGAEKREEIIGHSVIEWTAPEAQDSNAAAVALCSRQGFIQDFETIYLHRNGTYVHIIINATTHETSEGKRLVSFCRDITERKQAEEALYESEARFRSLYENTAIGIYRTTPAGQILLANPALVQMLGYDSFTELAQLHLIEEGFAPEHPRREFQERIERDGEVRGLESSWKRKDGSTIFVRENTRLVRDKNNKPIYYEGTAEDISARKQAEEALQKSEEQLRQTQKLEALGQLASGIAHDFNNILAIIMGHSSLLKMGQQSHDKVQHSIETIEKTSKRGADLVKQMMTLARRSEPVIAPVNLINMITDTVKMLGETFPKVIVFKTDFQLSLPYILADASQINQVLMNLCVNARDAMPQGGTLRIAAKRESGQALRQRWTDAVAGQYVLISVSDTGVGMDQATVDHIFEPFFTTKGPSKGTGLGMATVHGIVSNHHGFVEVESKPGVGTKVLVYLPSPLPSEISIPRETEKQQKTKGGSETVLIIEDEELLIEMLNAVLSKSGYKVLMAKDGMEGIELYTREKDKIALVLTDMGLPQLMGDAVFRRIREINPKAKVILASGYLSPDGKSDLYKAGLARFIQKPFMPVDILSAVREVLDSE